MKKTILLTSFTIVFLLAIALTLPAWAAGPTYRDTLIWEENEVLDDLCSFPVVRHADFEVKIKEWYDENGNFLKGHQSFGQSTEIYHRQGSERSLRSLVHGPVHGEGIGADVLLIKWTGPSSFVVVPGHGPAKGITGQLVLTFNFTTGEVQEIKNTIHFNFDEEDLKAFCDYLAGK